MKKSNCNTCLLIFVFIGMFALSAYKFYRMKNMPHYPDPMSIEEVWKHDKLKEFRKQLEENRLQVDSMRKEVSRSMAQSYLLKDPEYWNSYHGRRLLKPTQQQLDSIKQNNNYYLFPFNIYLNWNSNWEHPLNVPHYGMSDGEYGFIFSIHYKEIYNIKLRYSSGESYYMEVTNSKGHPVLDFPNHSEVKLDTPDKEKYGTLRNAREQHRKSN